MRTTLSIRLDVSDLIAEPALINRLVYEGETLYVERKESDPRDGLGATVASFANTLGGWLLIAVTNDRKIKGYQPKGTADLQDYVRDLLRSQIDPIPPFAAEMLPAGDDRTAIGVVRVPESSDQPHVTREGVVYRRTHGGKEPVKEARDIIAMARRGELARENAAARRTLPLIENTRLRARRRGRCDASAAASRVDRSSHSPHRDGHLRRPGAVAGNRR